jgi:hypothetical protein
VVLGCIFVGTEGIVFLDPELDTLVLSAHSRQLGGVPHIPLGHPFLVEIPSLALTNFLTGFLVIITFSF